ncbi:MAG: hypothetical protein Q9187_007241 [Circinaria calcarea]
MPCVSKISPSRAPSLHSSACNIETSSHPTTTGSKGHGEETSTTNPSLIPFTPSRKRYYGELRRASGDAETNGPRRISIEDHHEGPRTDAKRSRRTRSRSLSTSNKSTTSPSQIKIQSRKWSRKFILTSQKRRCVGRKSRFLEGSMNDRTSGRPPSIFMQDASATERAMEQYMTKQGDEDGEDLEQSPQFYDAGIEPTKPSIIWGLRKTLVNVLNPLAVWQGLNGMFKEQHNLEQEQARKKVLQKQQKLSKKVSNLEGKLELARRDLQMLTQEEDVPPVPQVLAWKVKAFVPGVLATLPSERFLYDGLAVSADMEAKEMPIVEKEMPIVNEETRVEKEDYDWGEDVF